MNQNNYINLTNILFNEFVTDKFWEFFLKNCSDDQLIRPDEFNYSRFFIQTPFFITLLYSKFNIPPPALNVNILLYINLFKFVYINNNIFFTLYL